MHYLPNDTAYRPRKFVSLSLIKLMAAIPSTRNMVLPAVCTFTSMWSAYCNRYVRPYDVRMQEQGNGVSRVLKLEDFRKKCLRILILFKIGVGEGGRFA